MNVEGKKLIYLCLFLFVISFLLYLYGLAPTVTLVDSGELIAAAYFKGNAHPPGFPTYLLISHIFTLIPIGNIAQRVNFVSCLFASFSIIVFFLLCINIIEIYIRLSHKLDSKRKKKEINYSNNSYIYASFISSLILMLSFSLWSYAEIAEVYTMNLFFILLTFLMLILFYGGKLNNRVNYKYIYIAALCFGLGLGIHHVTVVLMIPALFYIFLKGIDLSFFKNWRFALALICMMIGLSTYLYLIIAAKNNPVLNWGNPDNWERFFRHITAWQYRSNISVNFVQIYKEIKEYLLFNYQQFNPIIILLILIGVIIILKTNFLRNLFFLVIVCNLSYGLVYAIAEDKDAYYLMTYAFECIVLGVVLFKYSSLKMRKFRYIVYLLALIVIIYQFAINIKILPKNQYYIAEKYVNDTFNSMKEAGIYLTQDWQIYAPLFYYQHIYNRRPDIVSIDVNLLKRSWYVEYIASYYPDIAKFSNIEINNFIEKVSKFEKGLPYDSVELQQAYIDLINSFIRYAFSEGKAAYLGLVIEEGVGNFLKRIPVGLVYYLSDRENIYIQSPEIDVSEFEKLVYKMDKVINEKVIPYYSSMLLNRGIYLNRISMHNEAISVYQKILRLKQDKRTYELLADSYLMIQDKEKARFYYEYIIKNYGSTLAIDKKLEFTKK